VTASAKAVSTEIELLARELFALLEAIDPSRWRDELEPALRAKVAQLVAHLKALIARPEITEDPRFVALRKRLTNLNELIEESMPDVEGHSARMRAEWDAFRERLQPAYEELAANLRGLNTVPLPSLRPTNYARNAFHIASGIGCILLVQHVLTPTMTIAVAGFFTVLGWTFEFTRRRFAFMNRFLMWMLGPFAHPHERHRINSSTWFTSALFLLSLTSEPIAISVALAVLAFGDPFAAIVGRRWGRTKLVNRRSLEGSTAFAVIGGAAAVVVLLVYAPGMGFGAMLATALAASVFGAVAELFCNTVDDNLAVPLAAAAGAGVAGFLL